MQKRRSEGCGRGRRVQLVAVLASWLMVLAFAGCKEVDGLVKLEDMLERNHLKFETAQLSKAGLAKRMKEIDDAYAEPRTWAKVSLSLETSLFSISPEDGYAALWRGARACAWLSLNAATRADEEQYAYLGIAWGREAVKRDSTSALSYYYLALSEGRLLELRDYKLRKFARDMKGHLLMAGNIDPSVDFCGPKRALGRLLVRTRNQPTFSIGNYAEGLAYLEEARQDCPTFGENYLALAEALIYGGELERARTLLNQMVDMPNPPDHSADHQHWLAKASDLLNDLPGL